jgi:hypothetical protein
MRGIVMLGDFGVTDPPAAYSSRPALADIRHPLNDSRTISRERDRDPDLERGNAIIDDRTTASHEKANLRHGRIGLCLVVLTGWSKWSQCRGAAAERNQHAWPQQERWKSPVPEMLRVARYHPSELQKHLEYCSKIARS